MHPQAFSCPPGDDDAAEASVHHDAGHVMDVPKDEARVGTERESTGVSGAMEQKTGLGGAV